MNHLLKLGLKTQSTSVIRKYLKGATDKCNLFQEVFNYCVENNKNKALLYIVQNYSDFSYHWLSEENLSLLNTICDVTPQLYQYKALFNAKAEIEPVDSQELINDDHDNSDFTFDWEAEDDEKSHDGDDTALKATLQTQDTKISSVTIVSSESDLLYSIDVNLPVFTISQSSCSKFILQNKKILYRFYTQITSKDVFEKSDITASLSLYFEELDTTELLKAIDLSFYGMQSEHELDFNNDFYSKLQLDSYYIQDSDNRFEEWLDHLDMYIEEWKSPKLSNPIFKYYFHMLGAVECHPLKKEDEQALVDTLQSLTYQLVENEKELFIDEVSEKFNENFENPYVILSEEQIAEAQSASDTSRFIRARINNKEIFLRPISISDYFNSHFSYNSENELKEIKQLANKF